MNALFKLVLKGSAIGAFSIVALAAGCSDSSDDNNNNNGAAGESTTGGKSTGGSNSNAGNDSTQAGDTSTPKGGETSTMGGATGMGGDNTVITMGGDKGTGGDLIGSGGAGLGFGGQKGTGTGPSVAKFCNTLEFNGTPTTMILEVGEGADKVTFTATTGECVPADGDACTEIPQGDAVPVVMFDMDDQSMSLDELTLGVGAGEQLIFWTGLGGSGDNVFPIISGTSLDAAEELCKDVTYDQIP